MQLKSGATFIIIDIIVKFIWHAEFIDLQRSCSSQRGSFPTPPGSGGCWRRRPEGCLSLPLWREIQREKRTVNTCCSSASAQKSHPRPRKWASVRANYSTTPCACGLYRARMTPLPRDADWMTFDLVHEQLQGMHDRLAIGGSRIRPVAKLLRQSTQFLAQPWKPNRYRCWTLYTNLRQLKQHKHELCKPLSPQACPRKASLFTSFIRTKNCEPWSIEEPFYTCYVRDVLRGTCTGHACVRTCGHHV